MSAISFLVAYVMLFTSPAIAAVIGWIVSMGTRQSGHFFFEPRGFDRVNQVTDEHKEAIKVGYNIRRKIVLMTIWALRLSIHITVRNHGEGEDRRYQEIRRNNDPGFWWKSLYIVFGLQAFLAWVVSLPAVAAAASPAPVGWLDLAALLVWTAVVGDWQLKRFQNERDSDKAVLDTGLWRYSRHPNYFGEALLWWGIYLFALAAGAWWAVVSPLLMTILLLRVSGVALLEKDISERRPAPEVESLAADIRQAVQRRFDIRLEQEPRSYTDERL